MAIVERNLDQIIDDFINVKNFDVNANDPNWDNRIGNAFLDGSDDNATITDINKYPDASVAIQKAIELAQASRTQASVYGNVVHIPAGVYVLKNPICTYSCILQGEGPGTVLVGVYDDPNKPLVQCGYSAGIRDLCLRFNKPLITTGTQLKEVTDGQFVLIKLIHPIRQPGGDSVAPYDGMYDWLGYSDKNDPNRANHIIAAPYETSVWENGVSVPYTERPSNRAPCEGASFSNLLLSTCGTAIQSEPTTAFESAKLGNKRGYTGPFSCEFRNIFITHFSHRAMDFRSWWCSGSVFSNIIIDNYWDDVIKVPAVDCGLYLGESSSEHTFHQFNVQNFKLKNLNSHAIYIDGCNGFVASTVHIEAVYPTQNNQSFINIRNSSCVFQQLMICNAADNPDHNVTYSNTGVAMIEVNGIKNVLGTSNVQEIVDYDPVNLPYNNNYLQIGVLCIAILGSDLNNLHGLSPILIHRKSVEPTEDQTPFIVDIGNYSYYTQAWKMKNHPTEYANSLAAYRDMPSYGLVKFVQKTYNDSVIPQQTFTLPQVERNGGTKANPVFPTITNPQVGQLTFSTENKVYVCVDDKTKTWKALN